MICYYFLPDDYAGLQAQISDISRRIRHIGKEMGESCEEGAETYHDNFAYEEGERQQFMWSKRLCDLQHIRQHARIYRPESNPERVRPGCTVTYADEDTGEEATIRIGSFLNFADSMAISYNAPVPSALLGKEEGDLCEASVCGRTKRMEILEIR